MCVCVYVCEANGGKLVNAYINTMFLVFAGNLVKIEQNGLQWRPLSDILPVSPVDTTNGTPYHHTHISRHFSCNIQFVSSNINDDDAEAEASTSTSKSKIIVYVTLYERLSSGCIRSNILELHTYSRRNRFRLWTRFANRSTIVSGCDSQCWWWWASMLHQ